MKRIGIVLFMMLMLTGCGNAVEISGRDFVVMAGVDKAESDTFKVTAGSAVLTGEGGGKGKVSVKSAEGESLPDALQMNDREDALSPYYGQLKTVLIGENLLRDRDMFESTVGILLKNNDINMKTILLGCKGEAGTVVEATGKKENEYGLYIWDYYKNLGDTGGDTFKMTVNDMAVKKDGGYIMPKAQAEGDSIKIGGGFVMDGYVFKGELEGNEMRGAMVLTGDIKGTVISLGTEAAKIKGNSCKISFFGTDKKPVCGIDIFIKVQPLTERFDNGRAGEKIREDAEAALKKIYDGYGTDALGIYDKLLRKMPEAVAGSVVFAVNAKVVTE